MHDLAPLFKRIRPGLLSAGLITLSLALFACQNGSSPTSSDAGARLKDGGQESPVGPNKACSDPIVKDPPSDPPGGVCTDEYAPMCGVDGKTYANACEAASDKVKVAYPGLCK